MSVSGRLWHSLANLLCGTLFQVRVGSSLSPPWVDSGIAQGRILSTLLFNLLVDSLATTLRAAILVSPSSFLTPFCQLRADDLVILTVSEADLQVALDAVHAWGVRSPIFGPLRGCPDCCVHLGGVPLPLVQQYKYLGVVLSPTHSWRPHVDFVCSRGDQASAW